MKTIKESLKAIQEEEKNINQLIKKTILKIIIDYEINYISFSLQNNDEDNQQGYMVINNYSCDVFENSVYDSAEVKLRNEKTNQEQEINEVGAMILNQIKIALQGYHKCSFDILPKDIFEYKALQEQKYLLNELNFVNTVENTHKKPKV